MATSRMARPDDPLTTLSRRERQIMDVLYRRGRATAAEVQGDLADPPGYSAVRSALALLEERGLVRHEEDGRRYVYLPARSPRKARSGALEHVLRTFFGGSRLEGSPRDGGSAAAQRRGPRRARADAGAGARGAGPVTAPGWPALLSLLDAAAAAVGAAAWRWTPLLLAALVGARCARSAAAAFRHVLWGTALIALGVMLPASALLPRWQVPLDGGPRWARAREAALAHLPARMRGHGVDSLRRHRRG